MKHASHAALVAALLALAACHAAMATTTPKAAPLGRRSAAPKTHAAVEPSADGPFGVVGVDVPAHLVVDGRLDEWPARVDSGRRVFVAVTADALVLAADLPPAGHGVWLALAAPVPRVPDVGWIERGGSTHELNDERCQFEQVSGPEGSWDVGKKQPPEFVDACRALIQRHQDFVATFQARFVRRFALGANGVKALDAAGTEQSINGMVVSATSSGSVEARLPLTAMPLLAQAPLVSLFAVAAAERPAQEVVPPSEGNELGWTAVKLPTPVGFGEHAELLAAMFADFGSGMPWLTGQIAFHPAEPETIEVVHDAGPDGTAGPRGPQAPERPVVVMEKRALYTPLDELGDVKIGIARAHTELVVTHRGGKLVASAPMGDVRAVKRRGDELHLFSYSRNGFAMTVGTYVPPRWDVVAVKKDGSIDEEKADEGVDTMGIWDAWDADPEPFSDPDFQRFGIRGKRHKRPKTVTWQWNEKDGKYTSGVVPPDQAPIIR
jgi:hypothetical protein